MDKLFNNILASHEREDNAIQAMRIRFRITKIGEIFG